MYSNMYNQTFWIFHFLCGFGFFTHTKLKHKSKIKNKTMHTNKCKMHKMHEDMTFNVWRVLQRSKKLDQGPKKQKLNHRNHSSSKRNDCLEWMSYENWDEVWKSENRRGVKSIKHFLYPHVIFTQIRFTLFSTMSMKLKFLFSFNSFKSMKLRALRS